MQCVRKANAHGATQTDSKSVLQFRDYIRELRRLASTTAGDFNVTYQHDGEVKKLIRRGNVVTGDQELVKPIPLPARKFLWFRRLNDLEGPMPCTH